MRPRRKNKEYYVGVNWLCNQIGLNRGLAHYWSVRLKLRYLKFSGVRYIENDDALHLIENVAFRNNLDPLKVNSIKQYLKTRSQP